MNYNVVIQLLYKARNIVFSKTKLAKVENKNPYDFVTEVDTGISDFLKVELKKAFPDVGFVTEEEQNHLLQNKCFILDPIDGTTNLVYDYRKSSISLAYAENGVVQFGAVLDPFGKELFFSVRGNGAYVYKTDRGIKRLLEIGVENYKRNPLHVNERPIQRSLIEFGAGSSHKDESAETFARAKRVFENCLDLRRICSTALAISYIAAGRLDGYFEKVIKPWDYAAAILFLEEAGGRSATWDNQPLPLDKSGTIVCATKGIFDQLITLIHQQ
ncbi:MAG: inositol monophosphatase [Clostridia bacterium]|nr:inositol monophosphatase [Clostridia bacterium]